MLTAVELDAHSDALQTLHASWIQIVVPPTCIVASHWLLLLKRLLFLIMMCCSCKREQRNFSLLSYNLQAYRQQKDT
jgi:hypothetical protein